MAQPIYSHDLPVPAKTGTQLATGAAVLDWFRRDVPGYPTDDRLAQSNHYRGVIYVAVRAVADAMAAANVIVQKHKGKAVRKAVPAGGGALDDAYAPAPLSHPAWKPVLEPNPNETIGDILGYMTLQNRLTGTAPLWTVPGAKWYARGEIRPVELYALPTALCVPHLTSSAEFPEGASRLMPYYASGGLGFYVGHANAAVGTVLDNREIGRLQEPHPLWKWDGYSPLTATGIQLDILEQIDQSRWAAFQHGTTPDLLVTGGGLRQDQLSRASAEFGQKHGGARNARRVAFLFAEDADAKINVTAPFASAREMDYTGSWDQVVGMALAVFGVPRGVVNLAATSSYSELYAQLRQFYAITLRPFAKKVGEFLTRRLARPWAEYPGQLRVVVELPTLDDPDLFEKQFSLDLSHDLLTYNQALAARNRPPVKGGDVPVSVYVAKLQQEAQPQPDPMAMLAAAGGGKGPEAEAAGADGGPGQTPGKGDTPTGGAVPKPANKDAEGSGLPRVGKALVGPTEYGDIAPYGFCPECRTPGVMAERRPDGNAACANGHEYPRKKAKYASAQIELTGPAAAKLIALGRSIPDADLGADGREEEPHVTARYGLHTTGAGPVAAAVAGFGPVRYRLGRLAAFRGAECGKDYDVIYAAVDSPDLHRLHAALGALPHTDTWPNYVPHACVAYVKAGLADQYLAAFGTIDEAGVADELTFSTPDRKHTAVSLVAGAVTKAAMSAANAATGGALVAPPAMGGDPVSVKPRRKPRRLSTSEAARLLRRMVHGGA